MLKNVLLHEQERKSVEMITTIVRGKRCRKHIVSVAPVWWTKPFPLLFFFPFFWANATCEYVKNCGSI